jgi:flagellar protein FliS
MKAKGYEEYRVLTASPIARVRLMYDVVISETEAARECLRNGDTMARGRHVSKAFDIVTELVISLKPEVAPDLAANLKQFYEYIQWRLTNGHSQQSDADFEEVQTLMRSMREGWADSTESSAAPEAPEPEEATAVAKPVRPSNPYARQGPSRQVNYL